MGRISCLMITRASPDRVERLRAALHAFDCQSHRDRELVIVLDGTAADRERALAVIGPGRHVVQGPAGANLGTLRNLAVAQANGEWLCQWDDDDLHHPERLALQWAAVCESGKPAGLLQEVMQLHEPSRRLYCTNWAGTPAGGHTATLLCRRDAMPCYPDISREEDLAVALALRDAGALHFHGIAPHLFIYVTHGGNSMSADHHAMLIDALALSTGLLRRREAALREGLAEHAMGTVTVMGSNGPAFTLS